jgi:hypothetical protein
MRPGSCDNLSKDEGTIPALETADASPDPERSYLEQEDPSFGGCDRAAKTSHADSRRADGTAGVIDAGGGSTHGDFLEKSAAQPICLARKACPATPQGLARR